MRKKVTSLGARHVLITRFNIRVPEWRDVDKAGVPVLDDAWMIHRIDLFQKFTLPSVLAQTVGDFQWLILMDEDTHPRFKKEMESVFYDILYVKDWLKDLQKYLRGFTVGPKWLATTRLDNDDTIAPKFMETIQKNITTNQLHFINLTNGYTLHGHSLRPRYHIANPFMTLVEPQSGARSVLFTPHTRRMQKHWPVVQVAEGRLWTQIIHERNYINE